MITCVPAPSPRLMRAQALEEIKPQFLKIRRRAPWREKGVLLDSQPDTGWHWDSWVHPCRPLLSGDISGMTGAKSIPPTHTPLNMAREQLCTGCPPWGAPAEPIYVIRSPINCPKMEGGGPVPQRGRGGTWVALGSGHPPTSL